MRSAHIGLSVEVFVTQVLIMGVDIVHHSIDQKVADHLNDIVQHYQCGRLGCHSNKAKSCQTMHV
jgi:hypothetical protein